MTATATKPRFAPSNVPGEPPVPVVDIDGYEADKQRRQAEMDAQRPELLKCLNPHYAAAREIEKPMWRYTVEASWTGLNNDAEGIAHMTSKQEVVAQNENDAWSQFCDAIRRWPSRRDAVVKITKGKQLTTAQVTAQLAANVDEETSIPSVKIERQKKPKGR